MPNGKAPGLKKDGARVLVLAPTANDARLTVEFLSGAGFLAEACGDLAHLEKGADETCGCLIVAEETLRAESVRMLVETLERQPSWSDIPVVLITSGGEASRERLRRLALLGPGGNVTVLERPFRPATLVSAAAVALKARSRQYQVRDLLLDLSAARDEAERANRAKDDFLAALSHELRTPLNPVLLLAGEGAVNPTLPERVRADFSVIRKNINLEARLIDDLLDLTRIARGKLQLDKLRCDLHAILQDAIANVQGDLAEKRTRLTQSFQAGAAAVEGDPVRLQQVFWNVLKNAVKFAPAGGQVEVRTRNIGENRIAVQVIDSGIGLMAEEIEHIFDAFSQGEHVYARESVRYGGLGLGLSISRMLVEMHDGKIRAESDGPGHGATFTVELPSLAPDRPSEPSAPSDTAPVTFPDGKAARRRVLLVEDHEDTLAAMAFLLGRKYEVVTASTGKAARARAGEGVFDIVVSDIGLPDEKGYDLMAHLQKTHGLRGIALTGYGMEDDVQRSRDAGFIDHLTKPVEFVTLERALARAFDGHG